MFKLAAHAGHDHADTPAQTAQAGITLPTDVVIGFGVLTAVALVWLLTTYVIKLSLPVRAMIVLFILLACGIGGYSIAPIVSTISLALGFALALSISFLPFIIKR